MYFNDKWHEVTTETLAFIKSTCKLPTLGNCSAVTRVNWKMPTN